MITVYNDKYLIENIPRIRVQGMYSITQFYFAHDISRQLSQMCVQYKNINSLNHTIRHEMSIDKSKYHKIEYQVNKDIVDELENTMIIGKKITKVRSLLILNDMDWLVDEYENGLLIAEIINPNTDYDMPQSFGKYKNITGKFKYSDYFMSINNIPDMGIL